MNFESKIEGSAIYRQVADIAFGGEDINFFAEQVEFKIVEKLQRAQVAVFQHVFHPVKPVIESGILRCVLIAGGCFITPMGGQTALRNILHALAADLHFHPFGFGPEHGGMQRFVSIGLGCRKPVAEPVALGFIDISDDTKGAPAVFFLLLLFRVDDDADGEEVVYLFERNALLFHLLQDAEDGFGPAFYFVHFKTGGA